MTTRTMHQVLHGLAIKKAATAQQIAQLMGLSPDEVQRQLEAAQAGDRVAQVGGKYTLKPLARVALEADYSRQCASLRANDAFIGAYEDFERANLTLKTLITDWQTIEVAGQRMPNDHKDKAHDERIIDRLGALHERAEGILRRLAEAEPRFSYYRRALEDALQKAEDGAIEWVSDAKIDSYHTVWFELHEDLLRTVGRHRTE